jgi:hypothetical protein
MSELGPAYVTTCTSRECAELFSPFSSFDSSGVNFGRSIESVSLLSLPVNLNGTW